MVIFRSPHSIVIMTGILQAQEMEFTRLKQTGKFTTTYTPSELEVMTQATCNYTSMMMILAYHTVFGVLEKSCSNQETVMLLRVWWKS